MRITTTTTTTTASVGSTGTAPQRAATPSVVLRLLPGFEASASGRPLALGVRAQRLLALLAVRGAELARARVAGTLWPEATDARAFASLRSTLWSLPRLDGPVVEVGPDVLRLARHVRVDLWQATRLAHRVVEGGPTVPRGALQALRHDLLPHWSEEWLHGDQFVFQQLRLHALEALCRQLSARGQHAQAVEAGLLAVGCEPLRESAQRALISAHLAEGNRSEAVSQYHRYIRLARAELGLGPSEQMLALLQRALDDHAAVTPG